MSKPEYNAQLDCKITTGISVSQTSLWPPTFAWRTVDSLNLLPINTLTLQGSHPSNQAIILDSETYFLKVGFIILFLYRLSVFQSRLSPFQISKQNLTNLLKTSRCPHLVQGIPIPLHRPICHLPICQLSQLPKVPIRNRRTSPMRQKFIQMQSAGQQAALSFSNNPERWEIMQDIEFAMPGAPESTAAAAAGVDDTENVVLEGEKAPDCAIAADFVNVGAGATGKQEMRTTEAMEIFYAPEGWNFRAKDNAVDNIEHCVAHLMVQDARVKPFEVSGLTTPRLASIRAVGNIKIGRINLQDAFLKGLLTSDDPILFKPPPDHPFLPNSQKSHMSFGRKSSS